MGLEDTIPGGWWNLHSPCLAPVPQHPFFSLALKWDGIPLKGGTPADALAFALVRCEV